MKIYKLNQGSTFENLKHFIYLTNEYGVPSAEFVDDFIDQFGKIILNGNFTFSRYSFTELDDLWKEIEQDCKDNQTTCAYKYGSLFYYIIGSKAVSILKDTVGEQEWNSETEDNKLIYLKTFIEDFDKYITEGADMQEVYLENTPDLIKIDSYNEEYIDIKYKDVTGRLYRDKVVVNKGSLVREIKTSTLGSDLRRLIKNREEADLVDNITQKEMTFKSPSGAATFIYGACADGWHCWKNSFNNIIDIYRYKKEVISREENDNTVVVEKETVAPKKLTRDEQAAQVRAKMLASVHDIVKPVPVQQVIVAKPLVPNFVVQYIKSNIHVYMKEKVIVEVTGYDNESQYFYWDYHTGELKYIPDSEHSALSVKEQEEIGLVLNTCQSNGTITKLIKVNAQLDADGAKTTENKTVNFIEVNKDELYKLLPVDETIPQTVEESQSTVKHYRLKEEYNSTKGDDSLLDCEIDFNNDIVGTVVSDTEISIDNNIVDIREYIDKNNIDINSVTIGAYWFDEVYE